MLTTTKNIITITTPYHSHIYLYSVVSGTVHTCTPARGGVDVLSSTRTLTPFDLYALSHWNCVGPVEPSLLHVEKAKPG